MTFSLTNLVASVELSLAAVGLLLWWRLILRPAARTAQPVDVLPKWEVTLPDFIVFLLFVIGGSIAVASAASIVARSIPLRGDAMTVFATAFAQAGMLGGAWFFWSKPERGPPTAPREGHSVLTSGTVTFLISLPLLLLAAKISGFVLEYLGLPTERQSLIGMFANADSPWLLAVMIGLAVVVAPLTEEYVFRAGLFRYFRFRMPHWLALGVSALLFAALHVNWSTLEGLSSLVPLMVLAVMFSLAYERTGKIGTAIVAHALFNLNTVVLIFSGIGT